MASQRDYDRLLRQARRQFERQQWGGLQKTLRELLGDVADRIAASLLRLSGESGAVSLQNMAAINAEIDQAMGLFRQQYERLLLDAIQQSAQIAVDGGTGAVSGYLGGTMPVGLAMQAIPRRVVEVMQSRVLNGLNLSDRIWRLDYASRGWLQQDVLNSINQGLSAAKMAKRVEQWLLPGRELPRGEVPSAQYSNQPKSVSYNAYRLARTEINQSYGEARGLFDAELAASGVSLGTRWRLSSQHAFRMLKATGGKTSRDICDRWAERMPGTAILDGQPSVSRRDEGRMLAQLQRYGIDPRGVYLPGQAPTDHPNGLCTTETVLRPRGAIMEERGF